MDLQEAEGLPFLSILFSGMKPEPPPENLSQNSGFFKPPSPRGDHYRPNSTLFNNPCHFQNHARRTDLNYSNRYRHTSPFLGGNHFGGASVEGSSSNPFSEVDLPTIEGFNSFDACYNQAGHHNQQNDVNVFPYASAASVSFADSQKGVMHGGWGDYDDAPLQRHQDRHNHHYQMPSEQPLPETAQESSCVVQLPPLINYQDQTESSAASGVMLPAADEYSCNITSMEIDQLRRKKRHYMNKDSNQDDEKLVKGQWSEAEDSLLMKLVKMYGIKKWSQIAKALNGRVGKQCRERWHNHLRPDIKKEMWSEEEDKILIEAHMEIGNRWAEIAKRLPGRTENTIKNHWNATKRKQYIKRRPSSSINLNTRGSSSTSPVVNESILLSKYIKSVDKSSAAASAERKKATAAAGVYGEQSILQFQPESDDVYRPRYEKKRGMATAVVLGEQSWLHDLPDSEVYRPQFESKYIKKCNRDSTSPSAERKKGKATAVMHGQSRGLHDLPDSEVYRPQFASSPYGWLATVADAVWNAKSQQDNSSVAATMESSSSYISSERTSYPEYNGFGNGSGTSLSLNGLMQEHARSKKPDVDLMEMMNAKCP